MNKIDNILFSINMFLEIDKNKIFDYIIYLIAVLIVIYLVFAIISKLFWKGGKDLNEIKVPVTNNEQSRNVGNTVNKSVRLEQKNSAINEKIESFKPIPNKPVNNINSLNSSSNPNNQLNSSVDMVDIQSAIDNFEYIKSNQEINNINNGMIDITTANNEVNTTDEINLDTPVIRVNSKTIAVDNRDKKE